MIEREHTANVSELPIFEDQEVFPLGNILQPFDCPFGKVIDDVGMRFEYTYGVAYFFCDVEELKGGVYIGRNTEVGAFDRDEAE